MGGILLWIVLISTALGTGCTAWTSSGAGRLWRVDALELRRQQRFKHVLSCHVDAVRLSARRAAAPVRPGEEPVSVWACLGADPLRYDKEPVHHSSRETPEVSPPVPHVHGRVFGG